MNPARLACVALSLSALSCSPELDAPDRYQARIRRTAYGVAHIDARDLASLGSERATRRRRTTCAPSPTRS